MSSPGASKRRRDLDIYKLIDTKYEVTMVDDSNPSQFYVKFHGPADTSYEGGVWRVLVHLPETYPFVSPSVGFMNKIYHPNIDEKSGTVCLDVINQSWTPMYDLSNIFEIFLPQLLTYPNPKDPLNAEAAALYLHCPEDYKLKVKKHVDKYASEAVLKTLGARSKARSSKAQPQDDSGTTDAAATGIGSDSEISDLSDAEAPETDIP